LSVDAVAGAGDGGDDPRFAKPLAQSRDRDAHGVGERVCVLIPRPFQELFGADDTASAARTLRCYELGHIVGVSETAYVLATPRRL